MPTRNTSFLAFLALLPIFAGVRLAHAQTANSDRAAAFKVIDAYAATLDKIKTQGLSITVEHDDKIEPQNSPPNNPPGVENGSNLRHGLIEASWDGSRSFSHRSFWGNLGSEYPDVKKGDGTDIYSLFDGKQSVSYGTSVHHLYTGSGMVVTATEKRPALAEEGRIAPIREMLGYPFNNLRLDQILRQATALSLEQTAPEAVVIQAKTNYGTYHVTFDPTHDFHYIRLEIQRTTGDLPGPGRPALKEGSSFTFLLDSVQFKKFGDLWMPVEYHWIDESKIADAPPASDGLQSPGHPTKGDHHYRVTDLQLAPDFKALRSFEPGFVPEGAEFFLDDGQKPLPNHRPQPVVWKQGRFVPAPTSNTRPAQPAKTIAPTTSPDRAAALKVIDAYAATLDKIKNKGLFVTAEQDMTVESAHWGKNPLGITDGVHIHHALIETSWDGYRNFEHRLFWGDLGTHSLDVKKEDGRHDYRLIDGKRCIGYSPANPLYPGTEGGMVTAQTEKRPRISELGHMSPLPEALGYAYCFLRLDKVLRDATSLSLEKSDPDAAVIQAKTQYGTYRVTFDPTHDYHYTRLERLITGSDRDTPGSTTGIEGASVTITFDTVQFKKFGELWMPVEFHWINVLKNRDGMPNPDGTPRSGSSSKTDTHVRVTDLQFAPDFKARRTFEPTFIPDGAKFLFDNGQVFPNYTYQEVLWQKGRLIPAPAANTPPGQTPRGR